MLDLTKNDGGVAGFRALASRMVRDGLIMPQIAAEAYKVALGRSIEAHAAHIEDVASTLRGRGAVSREQAIAVGPARVFAPLHGVPGASLLAIDRFDSVYLAAVEREHPSVAHDGTGRAPLRRAAVHGIAHRDLPETLGEFASGDGRRGLLFSQTASIEPTASGRWIAGATTVTPSGMDGWQTFFRSLRIVLEGVDAVRVADDAAAFRRRIYADYDPDVACLAHLDAAEALGAKAASDDDFIPGDRAATAFAEMMTVQAEFDMARIVASGALVRIAEAYLGGGDGRNALAMAAPDRAVAAWTVPDGCVVRIDCDGATSRTTVSRGRNGRRPTIVVERIASDRSGRRIEPLGVFEIDEVGKVEIRRPPQATGASIRAWNTFTSDVADLEAILDQRLATSGPGNGPA